MKPRKEKKARLNGLPSQCSFCLVLALVSSSFSLSAVFFFSSAASGAPTERGRRRHKMRHDCIVMLSDCANAQFGAQVRVIHQTFISSSSPSSHDAFYGEKQSDANVRFVVPQRRDDGGLMILASRA